MTNLNTFFTQFLVTALWSSIHDDGSALDATYHTSDIAPEAIESLRDECKRFIFLNPSIESSW